jgi:DNA-binding response OmpR family regulator
MAWRVLVAESKRDIGVAITESLCQPAFETQVCPDAESALVALRRGKPYDTVVCDWSLPGMSGLEFIQAVRSGREFTKLPILVIGDHIRFDMESVVERAGANRFLGKPFTSQQVHSAVSALAAKYRPLTADEQAALNAKTATAPATAADPIVDPTPSSVIRIPPPEMIAEMLRRRPPK